MNYRKLMKKLFQVVGILVLFLLLVFANIERGQRRGGIPEVEMNYTEGDQFLSQEDIHHLIRESAPSLEEMPVTEIRTDVLESMLERQIYVKHADVSLDLDGVLNVKVTPRRAIARVMDTTGFSVYMDESGMMLPWSEQFSPRVPVFFLNDALKTADLLGKSYSSADINDSVLKIMPLFGVHRLGCYLDTSEFWRALVDQVIIGDELEMIPRAGGHTVVLGDFSDIDEKLNKLMIFYREGLNKVGWNKYSVINLKYRGQVVASISSEVNRVSSKVNKKVKSEAELLVAERDSSDHQSEAVIDDPEKKVGRERLSGKLESNKEEEKREKKTGNSVGPKRPEKKRTGKQDSARNRKSKQNKTVKT